MIDQAYTHSTGNCGGSSFKVHFGATGSDPRLVTKWIRSNGMQKGKNFERSTTGCELSISPGDGVGCVVGFGLVLGLGSGFGDGVGPLLVAKLRPPLDL